jgi:hypothetical protein
MLYESEISTIISKKLVLSEGYIEFIDRIHSMLKEPLLYIRVAEF